MQSTLLLALIATAMSATNQPESARRGAALEDNIRKLPQKEERRTEKSAERIAQEAPSLAR